MLSFILYLSLFSWPFSADFDARTEVDELHNLAKKYYNTDLDSASQVTHMALSKSRTTSYPYGEAQSLFILGAIANRQNQPDQAVPYLLEALNMFVQVDTKESLAKQAEICVTLGKIFRQHHSLDEAIAFYEQGLQYSVKSNETKSRIKLLNNKAIAHRKKGELQVALNLQLQKLDLTPINNHDAIYKAYNQIGLIYSDFHEFEEALGWYKKIIDANTNTDLSQYIGWAYHNMASVYQKLENHKMAWHCYEKSLLAHGKNGTPSDLFINYHDMAELALIQNQTNLALEYAQKAMPLLDKVPNTPEYYNHYHLLSLCLRESKPTEALAYVDKYVAQNETFILHQNELIANGEKYKVDLIASNYFNKVKRQQDRLKMAWVTSCAAAFIFVAFVLCLKLYRIYSYRSPELALSHLKNPNEMIYLLDLFRKEKEEMKTTFQQSKK